MNIPSAISSDEPLLRAFSLPSGLDGEKRATPLVFRLKKGEKDLSFTRGLYEPIVAFLKRAILFKNLSPEEVTSGAVELIAGEVESLDSHISVQATPTSKNPAHASIYYYLADGTLYKQSKKTAIPTDPSILGYELALASIVRAVYDLEGNVIWSAQ